MKQTVSCISIALTLLLLSAASSEYGQAQTSIDSSGNDNVARATLSEEDPGNSPGNDFVGSVRWRVDKADSESKPESQYRLRAEIVIPKRLSASLAIRLNLDQALPASHVAELRFDIPSGGPHGGVVAVRGILVKQVYNVKGVAVPGASIRLHPGVFTIAYPDYQVEETTELFYSRRRLDIAMIFGDGRRALLDLDKDVSGDAAFKQAFSMWGVLNPKIARVVARVDANRLEADPRLDTWRPPANRPIEHLKR